MVCTQFEWFNAYLGINDRWCKQTNLTYDLTNRTRRNTKLQQQSRCNNDHNSTIKNWYYFNYRCSRPEQLHKTSNFQHTQTAIHFAQSEIGVAHIWGPIWPMIKIRNKQLFHQHDSFALRNYNRDKFWVVLWNCLWQIIIETNVCLKTQQWIQDYGHKIIPPASPWRIPHYCRWHPAQLVQSTSTGARKIDTAHSQMQTA